MSGPDLPPEPPPFDPDDPGWDDPPAFYSPDPEEGEAAKAAAFAKWAALAEPTTDAARRPLTPAEIADVTGVTLDPLAKAAARIAAEREKLRAEEEQAAAPAWPLSRLVLGELAEAPPPRRWLLMQGTGPKAAALFPLGKLGILSAAGGTGKSMALCGLALAVATGRPWLQAGRGAHLPAGFGVAAAGRVALLLAEEDREEVIRRLYQAARLMGLDREERARAVDRLWIGALAGEPVELVERDGAGNVAETRRARQLRARLAEEVEADLRQRAEGLTAELAAADTGGEGWALVIVDPLSRFGGVDTETDNGAATRAIQALEALTKLPGGPAVMVAHHERKGSATDAGQEAIRGSSAIVDGARWAARLVPVMVQGEQGGRKRWRSQGGHRAVWFALVKTNYTPPMEYERGRLLMLDHEHAGALRVATDAEWDELRGVEADAAEAAGGQRSGRGKKPRTDKAATEGSAEAGRAAVAAVAMRDDR